ncbi:cell 12A endoglucanase [Circinella umbellata]|nr:cell 12A endoglucanase [Circinella umbellata]
MKRDEFCGQWDTEESGNFKIWNNLWGQDSGSGSQCTEVLNVKDSTISWKTSWSWSGGKNSVKSYANAEYLFDPVQLSGLSSIPFTWNWKYTGGGDPFICNVSFDIWTASNDSDDYEYEIMIWLAAIGGAGPLGNEVGKFSYGGIEWSLYKGTNGVQPVYSFIAGSKVENMDSDAFPFLSHLVEKGYLSNDQYLRSVQAGTEPFEGTDAVLETSTYKVQIK